MKLRRPVRRVDSNSRAIVARFRARGATWLDCSTLAGGAPDGLAGFAGRNRLVEIKRDSKAKLRDSQKAWARQWRGGDVHRVDSVEAVDNLILRWHAESQAERRATLAVAVGEAVASERAHKEER